MNIRSQISMVFHLDKCIGCHTCSLACKNLWTDRPGTEYMWWNNVETKPGTGYPTLWEDQDQWDGGWVLENGKLRLRLGSKKSELANIFYNPRQPTLDDYYHPFTYRYKDVVDAPLGDDQPVARPVSMITGDDMEIEAGPNWDDDMSGSSIYAANDPNLKSLTEEEKRKFFELQQLVYFYLPRMCNHCLNPSCVAACPSGAIYKRAEDGIVLVNQDKCQGWRMCISGCPYKKMYFNWNSGKAEKCILCYPRLEMGEPPACMHTCPGKIRYLGAILYDADRIEATASAPEDELVEAQRDLILDPFDPEIIRQALACGIDRKIIESAQKSPIFRFVKQWRMALPLHPEWRTLPMLFYIPPLLPVTASLSEGGYYELDSDFFSSLESARLPIRYMASLFSAGDEAKVIKVYRKLLAVRIYKRAETVGDITMETALQALKEAEMTPEDVEGIYHLTALAGADERMVVPPSMREQAVALGVEADAQEFQQQRGVGTLVWPTRGL